MTAVTATSIVQTAPNAGIKRVLIRTDSNAATGYTVDASTAANGGFTKLYSAYLNDDSGAVKIATWSSLVVTLGTISTGIHTLILEGI